MITKMLLAVLLLFASQEAFAKPSFSGGGGGGAKPSFSSSSAKPSFSSSSGPSTGKPSFSGGSSSSTTNKIVSTVPIADKTPTSVSKKPIAESFDRLSGTESRKVESRRAYEKAATPAATYKTTLGKEVNLDSHDKTTEHVRSKVNETTWQTRQQRSDTVYTNYHSRPVVVYNDYYHPYWHFWLMQQNLETISLWTYHHQAVMDQSRLQAIYVENAGLKSRVVDLEKQGVTKDPTYSPPGLDEDLMYDDNYVNAVFNPQPKTENHYEYEGDTRWWEVLLIVMIPIGILVLCAVIEGMS